MLISLLIFLLVSNAVTLRRDRSILFSRVTFELHLYTLLGALFLLIPTLTIYLIYQGTYLYPIYILNSYFITLLLLEPLLLGVFMVLDVLLFYIFFESILPPLFILIGLFGSSNRVRSRFFLFFFFIFIGFAVKTPTIFFHTWLLKAHVESPLGGSIILAAIVLKLSLYGILRLILPLLPKAYIYFTPVIYVIGVITIIYASFSTIITRDVHEPYSL